MNALEIRGLTKTYPSFQLDHLDLTLPSGCIMGLVGENGAGKSTTIKLILEMIRKESGTIRILGRADGKDIRLTKDELGVVLDDVGIPEWLNTAQVGKIMALTFRNWDRNTYEGLLKKLALPEKKPFKSFSRGMKMKLGIAIALSHHAKLLIMDEATSGLDPVVRDEVVEMLYEFTRQEDHSVLISSHIVSDLEKLCDYIAFLHQGRLLVCEEKDVLLERYGIFHGSREELADLDPKAVLHKKESEYGTQAIVERGRVPQGLKLSPISIEDLFLAMIKEAGK